MLIGGSGWGTIFCCYFRSLQDSLVTESGCSGHDGAGKLFGCIKELEFLLFLGGNFWSFYQRMPMQICCPLRDEIEGSLQDAIDPSGVA